MEVNSVQEIIRSLSWGVIGWYGFDKDKRVLYVGGEDDALIDFFKIGSFEYDHIIPGELDESYASDRENTYGTIVCISSCGNSETFVSKLMLMKEMLLPEGHLLIGINNRLGIRYFCGDTDPFTGREYDGIEGYTNISDGTALSGRCYSKGEISRILNNAGWDHYKFYSVYPGLNDASFIFADGYMPNEDLSNRIFPSYNDPKSVNMKEESLYPVLMEEGLFHSMANAFLIECTKEGTLSDVLQVTSSIERGREDALYTVIGSGGNVIKRPVWPEGLKKLDRMINHDKELRLRGIKVIESRLDDGAYIMPFIKDKVTQVYLKELLHKDKERFLVEMDRFRDTVLKSSDIKIEEDGTEVFKRGYFDLVPLNSFYSNGEFVFFDQEFCIENLPVKVMALRLVASFYFGDPAAEKIIPMKVLLDRYDLKEELPRWQKIEWGYLGEILNGEELKNYRSRTRTNNTLIKKRRETIDRRFLNIFEGIEGKKLYLFGSGKYAERFLGMYGDDFPVYGFLDNAKERQGTKKNDLMIYSPDILKDMPKGSYKVMICMKSFEEAASQLISMGVIDYSVYDPNRYYETRPRTSIRIVEVAPGEGRETETAPDTAAAAKGGKTGGSASDSASNSSTAGESTGDISKKHYHIGYCAGAFDMFHIGHLNLLRRARERCDYLIVGVMSDERMYNLKKKYPVIPCNERMQVVAGCRYVDRVEELPADRAGIMDAYHMFHYDCMFSGDDHVNDKGWLAERERLRAVGSDIVFVSYTKETSSSAIREKMKEG